MLNGKNLGGTNILNRFAALQTHRVEKFTLAQMMMVQ